MDGASGKRAATQTRKEERLKKMKSRFALMTIAALALCLSLAFTASAQKVRKAQSSIPPGPCHQNTKLCIQQMNAQISRLRAYVAHVKPGDTVKFSPQPDPPGDPDPWYG